MSRYSFCVISALLGLTGALPALASSADPDPAYPAALPPEAAVRTTMSESTRVRAGREQIEIGRAQERRLRVGPYEWEAAVTMREREDFDGRSYSDQQYELIRRLRLPGKGSLDRRMGSVVAGIGENAYADAWHETGRSLLSAWFEWLRAAKAEQVFSAQNELAAQEGDVLSRRVARGDAPRLDQQRADVVRLQMRAELTEARRRTEEARLLLQRDYPNLPLVIPAAIPQPAPLSGSDQDWVEIVVKENHEIELAQGRAEAASLVATRARRDRMPDPSISLQFSDNLDQNRHVVGLRVSIPIGTTGRAADAAVARGHAAVAEADAAQVGLAVEATARLDVVNARASHLRWQGMRDAAVQANAAAAAVSHGYDVGELGISELLMARRQQLDAQLQADDALLTAHEALARLWLDAHLIWAPDESGFRMAR